MIGVRQENFQLWLYRGGTCKRDNFEAGFDFMFRGRGWVGQSLIEVEDATVGVAADLMPGPDCRKHDRALDAAQVRSDLR